jgi:proteasome lid subunit RPN8/RPN11
MWREAIYWSQAINMKKQGNARVILSLEAQKIVLLDVCKRQHIEACGVFLGKRDAQENWQVEQACPLRNIFNSSVYFEFAPEDLLEVELSYPGQIIGVYHSHPTGFARASSTDRKNMQRVNQEQHIPWVWLIVRGPFKEASMQQAQGLLPQEATIAYYHYPRIGLRRVPIEMKGPGISIP